MKGHSTSWELAQRYRKQINAEFEQTKQQTTNKTKEGRKKQLGHLQKLSKKVQGRSNLALKTIGVI